MDLASVVQSIVDLGVFAIVLSILIIVHEWGHFITAVKLGVHVERFALGFGPKLFTKVHKGTEFSICLIPLGGYVKMAGDERDQTTGKADEFYSKSPGHRGLIVLNGPVVNFIMAYVCLVFVCMLGYPGLTTKIGQVVKGKPAAQAGLMVSDEITKVDGQPVYGWMELQQAIAQSEDKTIAVTVLRDGQELTKQIVPNVNTRKNIFGQIKETREIGVSPYPNIIGDFSKKSSAQEAGLKVGDRIIRIDGQNMSGWIDVDDYLRSTNNDRLEITVDRAGILLTMTVVPQIMKIKDDFSKTIEVRDIGAVPEARFESYKFGVGASLVRGFSKLVDITVMTYKGIYYMVVGSMSAKENVTGPVGIFYIVTNAAEMGFNNLLYILGVISASLAIFNLLPIIPLDGGHLLLLGIEKIRGRSVPPKVDEMIARIGFALIICLALFVFYSDFERFGWIDSLLKLWK
jgi:regulator of sigma E protease